MTEILILDKTLVGLIHFCPNCGTLTRPAPDFLTMAELDVLRSIGKGHSTARIARRRCTSVKSVESLIGLMCRKLGIERGNGEDNALVLLARESLKLGLSKF